MLCFRCGSHVQDGAEKCWNCGTQLATSKKKGASTTELRAKQRTNTRVFGVVFKVGDLIANRYRVKDIVGSGGAGVVYRAHDQEIDVDVAVKVINAKLVQTADEQRLFSRQTKIARKLSHQNVVRIYDEGRDEQRPFFTMQFLEGLSLRKIIDLRKEKKQTFALTEVEPIFNQLCQALEYAHKTTFHGNLKPDNVIVLPDLLKVTDFSLLRGLPRKPFLAIQKSRGTNFRYLAPEVRLEVPDLDKSVDVYSIGVVLAEMLTGLVFDDAKPEQLSIAGTGLDASVLSVVKRCVARAPKDRYPSAADVYDEIRKALTKGGGKQARGPESGEHPATAAEAPTQRLDISKHGDRPEPEAPLRAMPPPPPRAAAPVEVAAALSVGDAPPLTEGSGIFDAIEDDMIESAAPAAAKSEVKAAEAPVALEPVKSGNGFHPPPPAAPPDPMPTFGAISPAADLVDDPRVGASVDETEDETQAILDREPLPIPSSIEGLEEISNSSIELIDDPRATNRYQLGNPVGPTPIVSTPPDVRSTELPDVRTAQPAPLPDSAIPAPAFSQAVAHEATRHGRLDGGPEAPPRAPSKRPQTRSSLPAVTRGLTLEGMAIGPAAPAPSPPPDRSIPRSPTLAMDPAPVAGGKSHGPKQRPMTRPRMPTMAAAPRPSTSTLPSPAPLADPADVLARPLTLEMPKATGQSPVVPPSNNRALYFTVGAFALVVILALFVVLKVSSDQATASKEQIALLQTQLNSMAQNARQNEQVASADFEKEKLAAAEAKKSTEAAALKAKAAEEEKAKAEAEAKAREDEAKRQVEAAAKTADQAVRAEAEKKAAVLNKEAEAKRRAAEEAGKKEREEQRRLAEEQRKAEEAEKKRERAEAKMMAERQAAERAEERAKKAQDQKEAAAMERLAKEAEAEKKRAEADSKRAELEAKKAEEEARKKEAAERTATEKVAATEKAVEAGGTDEKAEGEGEGAAMGAAVAAAGGSCKNGMVLVPAGTFMMGSPQSDPERNFGDKSYESVNVGAFCIDYYEYPNGRGRDPTVRVNQKTADQRCKKAGKRLCTEDEWEKACKGPSGSRYPYANQWDPAACNTEDDEGNDRQVAKSGSFRKCRSGFNVFDLSGNVGEWTDSGSGGSYVVKGGSADRPGYDGRCAARKTKKGAEATDLLGFRCCADPG